MGKIVPFERKSVDDMECGDAYLHGAPGLRALSLRLSAISVSLQSAAAHGKTIMLQLERYKESLCVVKDFCDRCMLATELSSVDEMVRVRDELAAVLARQSATEQLLLVVREEPA